MKEAGVAIIGQTADLARRQALYAIRDVTGTVDPSAHHRLDLSKKLAAGLDALILDVKTGSGAFMPTLEKSRDLARSLVAVANGAGLRTGALITDMNEPLASAAGNALEVRNAVDFLTGRHRDPRLREVTLALCGAALDLAGIGGDTREAAEEALASGRATERFARMVAALGGPPDFVEQMDRHLAPAPIVREIMAPAAGVVAAIDTRGVGMAVVALGGGRRLPTDAIDHAVGFDRLLGLGAPVDARRRSQPFTRATRIPRRTPPAAFSPPTASARPPPPIRSFPTASNLRRPPDAPRNHLCSRQFRHRRRPRRRRLWRRGQRYPRPHRRELRPVAPQHGCDRPRRRRRAVHRAVPRGLTNRRKGDLWGVAREVSKGKDTPSGHWEIGGVPVPFEWGYFPRTIPAFPAELTDGLIEKAGLPGILGNKHASGVPVIQELGEESIRTGKPICYTSADSVFQVAAHETHFGLDRTNRVCEIAYELTAPMKIGRVIARPFIGETPETFKRTGNRRDFASPPPEPTRLGRLKAAGRQVFAIGKISDIYAGHGVTHKIKATGNVALFDSTLEALDMAGDGALVMTNFVDFDQEYGHRRDVPGYAEALMAFDRRLPELIAKLRDGDLLVLTADHGNDPTWRGTDHTREQVPILVFSPGLSPGTVGLRSTFADIGESVAHWLGLPPGRHGRSFL